MRRSPPLMAGLAALLFMQAAAHAACPVELATYRDRDDVASVEFQPTMQGAATTNTFRMILGGSIFDGIVMWTDVEPRPYALVTYKCPDGDLTGDEIRACTVWEGAVYAIDAGGAVDLLPREGKPAPAKLVFAGLGPGVHQAPAFAAAHLAKAPWDVFEMSGCQE